MHKGDIIPSLQSNKLGHRDSAELAQSLTASEGYVEPDPKAASPSPAEMLAQFPLEETHEQAFSTGACLRKQALIWLEKGDRGQKQVKSVVPECQAKELFCNQCMVSSLQYPSFSSKILKQSKCPSPRVCK